MWVVDYGTTWIKYHHLDKNKSFQFISPPNPKLFLFLTEKLLKREGFKKNEPLVIGFPGHIKKGKVISAPELDEKTWLSYNLDKNLTKIGVRPHLLTHSDLHGYLVVQRQGRELVLSLGDQLGSSLFVDGVLWPGTELGELTFSKGKTYNDILNDRSLRKTGKKNWIKNMKIAVQQLDDSLNPDRIFITGDAGSHLLGFRFPTRVIIASSPEPSKKLASVLKLPRL